MGEQEQMRPASPEQAPDPARAYERAKPEAEAGMGSLKNSSPDATPTRRPDEVEAAVRNREPGSRQINSEDAANTRLKPTQAPGNAPDKDRLPPPEPVDHSMLDEEPDGWDQAPQEIQNPRRKRHPRTEGKGGTP
jgi:hypothetical protein